MLTTRHGTPNELRTFTRSSTGGFEGPLVMSRRAYSITAPITLLACRRVLAAATSRPPSPISDVKMVA